MAYFGPQESVTRLAEFQKYHLSMDVEQVALHARREGRQGDDGWGRANGWEFLDEI